MHSISAPLFPCTGKSAPRVLRLVRAIIFIMTVVQIYPFTAYYAHDKDTNSNIDHPKESMQIGVVLNVSFGSTYAYIHNDVIHLT